MHYMNGNLAVRVRAMAGNKGKASLGLRIEVESSDWAVRSIKLLPEVLWMTENDG